MVVIYAAGILPVTWSDGQPLFLVGRDVRDNSWSDFGGKCERVDKNDPLNTACREFYEETYGCVVEARALRHRLSPVNCLALRGRTQNSHPYWMYVAEVPYLPHLRNAFHKTLNFLRHKNLFKLYVEKTDVRWVTFQELVGSHLPKRQVFKATLDSHAHVLSRVAAGEPWAALCAEFAGSHSALPAASDVAAAGACGCSSLG